MPTSPFVVRPQTKKVPNSSQKAGVRAARNRAWNARAMLSIARPAGAVSAASVAPYGLSPTSDGRSTMSSAAIGTSAALTSETARTTGRQPPCSARAAMTGRKTRAPVAVEALSRPITRPRLLENQRFTTAAPSTEATAPDPIPESTPQVAMYCQGSRIMRLSAVDALITTRPASRVRLMPSVCMSAAAKGPTRP
jgi:hypothetical protein